MDIKEHAEYKEYRNGNIVQEVREGMYANYGLFIFKISRIEGDMIATSVKMDIVDFTYPNNPKTVKYRDEDVRIQKEHVVGVRLSYDILKRFGFTQVDNKMILERHPIECASVYSVDKKSIRVRFDEESEFFDAHNEIQASFIHEWQNLFKDLTLTDIDSGIINNVFNHITSNHR